MAAKFQLSCVGIARLLIHIFCTNLTVSGGVDCMIVVPAYANSDCYISVDAVFSKRACIVCSAAAKEFPVSNASSTRITAMPCNLDLFVFSFERLQSYWNAQLEAQLIIGIHLGSFVSLM
jgi:hypothetical protein